MSRDLHLTDTPDIDPPVFKIEKGRKQTKRRKGQFEVPQPQPKITSRMESITCSNCKLVGHRYTNCSATLKPSLQMRRNHHQQNRDSHDTSAPSTTAPTAAARPTTTATPAHTIGPTPATPTPAARTTSYATRPVSTPTNAAGNKAKITSLNASAAANKRAGSSAMPPPARFAFIAPRPTLNGVGSRPIREKRPPSKLKGYLTASRIHEK